VETNHTGVITSIASSKGAHHLTAVGGVDGRVSIYSHVAWFEEQLAEILPGEFTNDLDRDADLVSRTTTVKLAVTPFLKLGPYEHAVTAISIYQARRNLWFAIGHSDGAIRFFAANGTLWSKFESGNRTVSALATDKEGHVTYASECGVGVLKIKGEGGATNLASFCDASNMTDSPLVSLVRDKKQAGTFYVGDYTGGVFVLRSARPNRHGFCHARHTIPSHDVTESPAMLCTAHDRLLVVSGTSVNAYNVRFLPSRGPILEGKMDLPGPAMLATTSNFDKIETVVLLQGTVMKAFVTSLPQPPPEPWFTIENLRWPILGLGAAIVLAFYYFRSKVQEQREMQGKWKSFERNWKGQGSGGAQGAAHEYGAGNQGSSAMRRSGRELVEDAMHATGLGDTEDNLAAGSEGDMDSEEEERERMAEEAASTVLRGMGRDQQNEVERRVEGQPYFPSGSEDDREEVDEETSNFQREERRGDIQSDYGGEREDSEGLNFGDEREVGTFLDDAMRD
jgi:hypothetical protein